MSDRSRSPRALIAALVAAGLIVVPALLAATPAASGQAPEPRGSARDALAALGNPPAQAEGHQEHDHSIAGLNAHGVDTSVQSGAGARAGDEGAAPSASEVPAGFQDLVAIGNLSEPVAVAFAADGTAFVALKTGVIKSFEYVSSTGTYKTEHTNFANLDVNVNNYWDRGLTGIAVDPQFGSAGHNYIYVNYAYNRDPRDNPAVVPKWGQPGQQYDECTNPASMGPPVVTGCLINIRVSRLEGVKVTNGWVMNGAEQPLLEGACMQFPSHASGDVAFGPDGSLYASAGDGASFDTEDWGQGGDPCPGDPDDEGGSLRSQDPRTSGDPLSISGSIFRLANPTTAGAINGTDVNPDRIVAYGQRNPWRLTFRPGTSELWSGDVGGSIWEEVNRVDMSTFTTAVNRGWPCYEGSFTGVQKQPGWDALNKPICENLYTAEAASPGTVKAPYFSYRTRGGGLLTPGENCQQGTSSISGIAFVPSTSSYPAAYRGSLFFNDYARGCIWRLGKLPNGDPDPNSISPFVEAADTPVGVEIGPGGDLFYVDYGIVDGVPTGGAGDIHRIVYTPSNQAPVAAVSANPTSGPAPLIVNFDAAGSSDADPGDTLSYTWDLDGNGTFGDATEGTASRTYNSPGNVTVTVQVSDGHGGVDTASVVISPGNTPPSLTSVLPSASQTWQVGQTINFSATATDGQQTLTDAAYTWSLSIAHCPSVCHTHPITTWVGQRTGSFVAPDHEYPSRLLLNVTVTDNQGLSDTGTINEVNGGLAPESVLLSFATTPGGGTLTVAGNDHTATHNQTFIVGSNFNVTAPPTRVVNGANYTLTSWSDGGAQSHPIAAPSTATTYTATYTRVNRLPTAVLTANPMSGTTPFRSSFTASATDPDGDNSGFTHAWDLDKDGAFDDGTGTTASRSFTQAGSFVVRVRATDSQGGTDTEQVTIMAKAPVRRRLVITTRPDGMAFKVDGERRAPGWDRKYPVGATVRVGAFLELRHDGHEFDFVRWSDGGGRHHKVTIPDERLELKAIYRRVPAKTQSGAIRQPSLRAW